MARPHAARRKHAYAVGGWSLPAAHGVPQHTQEPRPARRAFDLDADAITVVIASHERTPKRKH